MPGPTERSTVDFRSFLEAGFEWRTIFVDVLRRLKEEEILELKDLEAKRFRFKEWKHVKTSRDDIVVPRRGNFFLCLDESLSFQ
jgi:hypothetical protein